MQRLYGNFEPISEETKAILNNLYEKYGKNSEKMERNIAYSISNNQQIINQELLFAGATAINEAYMLRNTHKVVLKNGKEIKSLKLRDFKDDKTEDELKELLAENKVEVERVAKKIKDCDIDKRKNFQLDEPVLYRIKSGKYKDLCFSTGTKTNKDGTKSLSLFLDIANTPFEKLTKGWQESNFDPFEFAYKMVKDFPKLSDDEYAAIVHVYWLATNQWAIEYNDPMAVPYNQLDRVEQIKDGDNVLVANVFNSEEQKIGTENLNKEKCLDIVKVAKSMLIDKLKSEQENTEEKNK